MNLIEASIHMELQGILSDQFDRRVLPHVGWESGNNLFCPDLLVYEEGRLRRCKESKWFAEKPRFVVEVVTGDRSLHGRQQGVNAYLAHGAGAVVEVMIADEILLVHHPENTDPLVVRSRMEWPFVVALDELFEEARRMHQESRLV
jgi:Uma2 family endonuclease